MRLSGRSGALPWKDGILMTFRQAQSAPERPPQALRWRSAEVRASILYDGRSNSHAGILRPMMTMRRRAASLWERTSAQGPVQISASRAPSTATNALPLPTPQMAGAPGSTRRALPLSGWGDQLGDRPHEADQLA